KERIYLGAAIVLGANGVEIGGFGQTVLGDDINVAAVKVLVCARQATAWQKAFAKDHVSRAKKARVTAAKEHRIARHLRIQGLSVCACEGRLEHVMTVPVSEPVAA